MSQSLKDVRYLPRPGGRIAFTDQGQGPLVVGVPGMGDLRSAYRSLADALTADGYRVVLADVRGHGDSDTTFTEHGDAATGSDVLALIEHLGGPAVVMGNSMGAAAALWAAAERPEAVAGLVLLGPFVRDADVPAWRATATRLVIRAALLRPWGPAAWAAAYRSFAVGADRRPRSERRAGTGSQSRVRGRLPEGFDAHVAQIRASLKDPAHLASLRDLVRDLTHREVHERLDAVRAPVLLVMGAQDPDFADPAGELAYIEQRLAAAGAPVRAVVVDECGHYPHLQRPDLVVPEALALAARAHDVKDPADQVPRILHDHAAPGEGGPGPARG